MSLTDEELYADDLDLMNSIYQAATLATLLFNKKATFQNFFILFLTDKKFNRIVKEMLDMDSDIEVCKNILYVEPNLTKSKALLTFAQSYAREEY